MNRVIREIMESAAVLAPAERRQVIRRRARGREDTHNLRQADYVFVSYGKSGRTWLRVMLSRFFQLRYGLPDDCLLSFDNLHGMNRAVPKILFTHDNYIRDYTGAGARKTAFYDKATVLLVRHPGDVAVSQYFQWRHRMQPYKKELNAYPPHGSDISIFDFVMHQEAGLGRVVQFMNEWAAELPQLRNRLVVRYELLRADCPREIRRILSWMGQSPSQEEVDQSVTFGSFENLKEMEARRAFKAAGKRMTPGDKADPDSYKVRRAKVGGYRDYFDDNQVREIDAYIHANLSPLFAYGATDGQRAAN
ncbi:MAG TPA: sulfotransferase domain-containing protein [Dongiaceae bacterium]|nr:sulfotransferase domain-containing protein [Dongiaceae bacterium]